MIVILSTGLQLWIVGISDPHAMAKSYLLGQVSAQQLPTSVTKALCWWEAARGHARLMVCGLERHLSACSSTMTHTTKSLVFHSGQ